MDATPSKRTRYEFKIRTGEITKDVAKGFLITTQQYGFAVEQLNNLGPRTLRHNSCNQERDRQNQSSSATSDSETAEMQREEQEDEESAITETTETNDVNSTLSPISNSGSLPDIDDVNRLLAEGRQMRAIERIKEEIRSENPFREQIEERRHANQMASQRDDQVDEVESENQSPGQFRSPPRAVRSRKQTQHFGEVVPRSMKRLFFVRGEDQPISLFSVSIVSGDEKIINKEMLANSREEELKGWHEFKVVREVPLEEMISCNVRPL